jgi:hypothetical protein
MTHVRALTHHNRVLTCPRTLPPPRQPFLLLQALPLRLLGRHSRPFQSVAELRLEQGSNRVLPSLISTHVRIPSAIQQFF